MPRLLPRAPLTRPTVCSASPVSGPAIPLTPTERGHGYNAGLCNSIQQTASGIWVQVVGGADLNDPDVQGYLEWLRNRYTFTGINPGGVGQGWPSYYYYLWTQSKALSFLDDSGVTPNAGNIDTSALGTLAPAAAPAFATRELHRDPTTDPQALFGGGGGPGYYNDPNEPARWYYDGAYQLLTHQDGLGNFNNPEGGWEYYSDQSYAILYLERSVGGGCVDTDGDGVCDFEDNCPASPNPGQEDTDGDGVGDVCDECPDLAAGDDPDPDRPGCPRNEPPDCSNAAADPDELWPPNHKFNAISVVGVTDPDGDAVMITIDSIFQDEPTDTFGDGNFTPDGQGVGTATAEVRAERSGTKKVPGDGRVYHIGFTADDGQGAECSENVTVCVPHDQGNGSVCVDGGALFDSTLL